MVETTYHENKLYLPKEIREKLGLTDGDVLQIDVVNENAVKISVVRSSQATAKLLEKLHNPPNLGKVKGKLSREEIYEDIT